ncbi:MAG: hypothetical protein JSU96_07515 [Acidobacteriota bacterium]|nr:MAG: hypothetical protein JSU96_07515 [Acidobacteriota bacterium]
MFSRYISLYFLVLTCISGIAAGQRFLPDDPVWDDPDQTSIEKPLLRELSQTYDTLENTFGSEAGPLVIAENVNTLGEVPNSSWFTNRIGRFPMSVEEVLRGGTVSDGPDVTGRLTVAGGGLLFVDQYLTVVDSKGDRYLLTFDREGFPNLATGAGFISGKLFHAMGYNVPPVFLVSIDPEQIVVADDAVVIQTARRDAVLDQEFVDLLFEEKQVAPDGRYRALAYEFPDSESVGEFKFFGTRPDDPNDVFFHENRRELRGLRVFSAWLNHYLCRSIHTRDLYLTENGRSFLKHYLIGFGATLGSGLDLNDRIIPKDELAGYEYSLLGDVKSTLKTALSFGFWKRPWLKVSYRYPEFQEIGRIESEYFEPAGWRPSYPNPAFDRMLPDDAFWAASIVAQFPDEVIRAVVKAAQYSDPEAEAFLSDTIIRRRDKVVDHYFSEVNPLSDFSVDEKMLVFRNLGVERGLAQSVEYEYEWFVLDNANGELASITEQLIQREERIPVPQTDADYLVARIRTRSPIQRNWKQNVEVSLRVSDSGVSVVGIDREIGAFTLERSLEGGFVVRSQIEFGGTYQGLEVEQRRLVDNYFGRLAAALGREFDSEEAYDNLPLSVRTTFEAVTNALLETPLTDIDGTSRGPAIGIVDQVEAVHGRIRDARGDHQFRIYVTLKDDAVDQLKASNEFQRGADNTVYHKGYPQNYRQQGGAPSMQVSIAEDDRRADIDVDYRSSSFPSALFNGHLTAANSDVRAGDNHVRHTRRWEGFRNWWRGLLGLPVITSILGELDREETIVPIKPRKGSEDLEVAVGDFFESWLVEQRPELSAAYFAQTAYSCIDLWRDAGDVDYGIAPFVLVERMAAVNRAIGQVARLQQIASSLSLEDERLELFPSQAPVPFTLYKSSPELSAQLMCNRQDDLRSELDLASFRDHFLSAVRLKTGDRETDILLLWAKKDGDWKIVSTEVFRDVEQTALPTQIEAPVTLVKVTADPEFLRANREFLVNWRRGVTDTSFAYFSRSCIPCIESNVEGLEGQTDQALWIGLREAFDRVAERMSRVSDIWSVVKAVEFVSPQVRVVEHPDMEHLTIGSLPDHLAEQYLCSNLGQPVTTVNPDAPIYGNYYATMLQFDLVGDSPPILGLLWAREAGSWRIVAFNVIRP